MKMNLLLECKVKKCIRSLLYGALVSLLFTGGLFAQERTVSGTVTSGEDGSPIPGVNVIIKGTTSGTATDFDGKYTLKVPSGDVILVFSYIGFTTEEIQVGNRTVLDVVMTPDITQLGEIVVTSLGIEKEKRQLAYAAQNVNTKELSVAKETNVLNSLAGKVAGMDMVKSNAGVGSSTRVTLRGIRSMGGNNQPLLIIDGVPASGTTNSGPTTENGGWQSIDGFSNLNPDDIASITVLKGANAAALYGSRAQNGAIIITTKKGKKGLGVDFSTNFSIEKPMILTKFQQEYGQGSAGTYIKNSEFEWGPKLTGQMVEHWSPDPNYDGPATYPYVAHPDNFKDFFTTGWNWINTIGINAGTEKSQAYISYTNTRSQGIVPNNRLARNNFNVRFTSNITKNFSADAKISYIQQDLENLVATGDSFWNPMRALYRQPTNISLDAAKDYEYYTNDGTLQQNYWNPHSNGGENVYWMLNRTGRFDSKDRVIAMGSLKYEFVKGLSLQVRGAMDWNHSWYKFWAYNDTYTIADAGALQYSESNSRELNVDFILSYTHQWGDNWSLDISLGGNHRDNQWEGLSGIRVNRFLKPNLFTLTNTSQLRGSDYYGETKVNSLYGWANIGFKNFLFLEVTGRNDWSSTLPPDSWSYFYPSFNLSWVISDMINSLPNWLSLAKVRASYAIVGNGTGWAQLEETFSFRAGGQLGYADKNTSIPAKNLKPEETHSLEIGAEVRLWQDRLGVDFTWYKTNTFNQLIRVPRPYPSGASSILINAGNIQNKGYEFTINATPVRHSNFTWDLSFNYAHNQNDVIELTDELTEYTVRGRSWMTTIKVVEGMPYGMIYTKGFERDENGNVLVNQNGLPITTPGQTVPMGNYLPDWMGGFSTNFTWKKLVLSATCDMRFGGKIFSFTEANLASDGFSDYTLEGREGMVVKGVLADTVVYNGTEYLPGQENPIEITSEDYWQSLGGRNTPTGEPFGYDASFVRLREVVLGYNFKFHSTTIKALNVSLYGRNLMFLYNASKVVDPNMTVGTGNYQGYEGFGLPTTRQYGISAKISF